MPHSQNSRLIAYTIYVEQSTETRHGMFLVQLLDLDQYTSIAVNRLKTHSPLPIIKYVVETAIYAEGQASSRSVQDFYLFYYPLSPW